MLCSGDAGLGLLTLRGSVSASVLNTGLQLLLKTPLSGFGVRGTLVPSKLESAPSSPGCWDAPVGHADHSPEKSRVIHRRSRVDTGRLHVRGTSVFSHDSDFLTKHETIQSTLCIWSEPGGSPREDVARAGLGAQRLSCNLRAEEWRALPEREPTSALIPAAGHSCPPPPPRPARIVSISRSRQRAGLATAFRPRNRGETLTFSLPNRGLYFPTSRGLWRT